MRRAANADLEKFFGFFPPFQRSKRYPPSIVIHQVIVIVKVTQRVIDLRDGNLEHRERHLKVSSSNTSLKTFEPFACQ